MIGMEELIGNNDWKSVAILNINVKIAKKRRFFFNFPCKNFFA